MHTREIRKQQMSLRKGPEPIQWCLIWKFTSDKFQLSSSSHCFISTGSVWVIRAMAFHTELHFPLLRWFILLIWWPRDYSINASDSTIRQTHIHSVTLSAESAPRVGRLIKAQPGMEWLTKENTRATSVGAFECVRWYVMHVCFTCVRLLKGLTPSAFLQIDFKWSYYVFIYVL